MLRNVISTASRASSRNVARAAAAHSAPFAVVTGYNFSTGKKIVDIRRDEQRNIWDAYLLGSISAESVFQSLDLNKSGAISVEEINYFMDSVDKANVSDEAFTLLKRLGADHHLDVEEFERWLCMGTELRRVNPALEGILDNLDDSSSSDDEEESSSATGGAKMVDARRGLQQLVSRVPYFVVVQIDIEH